MCLFTSCSSYSACIMVLPLNPFDLPFLLHNRVRWQFAVDTKWLQCEVYDRWGTSCTMPCLLCYETGSTLLKLRQYGFHISRYGALGALTQMMSVLYGNFVLNSDVHVLLEVFLCTSVQFLSYFSDKMMLLWLLRFKRPRMSIQGL